MLRLKRDNFLTDFAKKTLRERYMIPGEESPQEALMRAARAYSDDEGHAERIYTYASKLWLSFATPVLSNAPIRRTYANQWEDNFNLEHFERQSRGLPISCFLNYVDDSREGLNAHYSENVWLSSIGGGIGTAWSAVRSDGTPTASGSCSTGLIPFLGIPDRQCLAFSQGTTRRGSYAAYLDISHPEIKEFISLRKPTGGDLNRKALNIHHGVNLTDAFMRAVEAGSPWDLIDPHTKQIKETVDARELWQSILETRVATGEPYVFFSDTANRDLPQQLRDKGLKINNSNLCTEIMLPTAEDRTAVCCLSSVNALFFDQWSQEELFIEDIIRFLDNVLQYFIVNAEHIPNAVESAKAERSLGLGMLGFHSYLQTKLIPYESPMAISATRNLAKHIQEQSNEASAKLAKERGEPSDLLGSGRRNAHLTAIAPNASSSVILGCSPSIEPWSANAFQQKTSSGVAIVRNPQLAGVLESIGQNTEEVWSEIIKADGSVQGIQTIPEEIRDVFKTAFEIDQQWIIELNSHRQGFVDQGISVNIFLPADCHVVDLHNLHMKAWKQGLKSLYYLRSKSIRRAENVTAQPTTTSSDDCIACEG